MKVLKLSLVCIVLLCLQMAWANAETVTLQNGLDGYTGCIDADITSNEAGSNYGDSDFMWMKEEYCVA